VIIAALEQHSESWKITLDCNGIDLLLIVAGSICESFRRVHNHPTNDVRSSKWEGERTNEETDCQFAKLCETFHR